MRLLIVDDDLLVREFLQEILAGADTLIDMAPDCRMARELLDVHSYDAITLDLCLPDGSGFDILFELRQKDSFSGRVIIISGDANQHEHISRAKYLKADAMFLKPFDWRNLRRTVLGMSQALSLPDPAIIFHSMKKL